MSEVGDAMRALAAKWREIVEGSEERANRRGASSSQIYWIGGHAEAHEACAEELEALATEFDNPRYELTDLGKAYRAVMQRGAKLNGGVKAGEGGE